MSFLYSKKWKKGFKVSVVSMLLLSTFISSIGSERVSAASAPVPGGTGLEPVLWLKADSDATTADGLLTDWKDQSANEVGFDLVIPTGKTAPSYNPGGINFNPSVAFDNPTGWNHYNSSVKFVGDKPITFQSGYAVYKFKSGGALVGATEPTGTNGVIIMGGYGDNFTTGNGVHSIFDYYNPVDRSRAQIVNFDIVSNTDHTARIDGAGAKFTNRMNFDTFTFTPVIGATSGRNYNWSGLVADVAEIILYDNQTANDASKIESYLAIKYGITLNNGASPYLSTNESEVWTVDSKYKHNIAGIGKDEAQGLNQKQSLSINAGVPQVAVGVNTLASTNADNPSVLTDQQYLVWADNGLPLTYDQPINKPGQYHAQRVWKVQNTNNVGEVEIGIPAVSVPAGYQLLVSDSEDFTDASGYELSLKDVNGIPHYTAKAALKDGEYFTFSAWAPKYTSANVSNVSVTEDEVIVTFDEELDFSNVANLTGFKLEINGQPITIDSFEKGANSKTLKLKTSQIIPSNASVIVSYDIEEGNLKGTNGAPAQSFSENAVTKVDKSLLQAKVTEVTGEDLEESEYTPASWIALKDAMNEAERVLNDLTVTQAQVDKALLDLTDARTGLIPTTSVPVVDKSVLQAKVTEITGESLEESAYTPASWETLDDAMNEAERVLNEPTATQAQVDKALQDLTIARTGLTKVNGADTSTLQTLIPSTGSLSPAFDPAKDTYTISVPNSVYQFQLTPTALDPLSKIEIAVGDGEWNEVTSGNASENLPLQVGGNTILVKVTDALGHVTEYKINVNRASSDNGNNGGGNNGGGNTGGNSGSTPAPTPAPVPTPTPAPVDNLETTRDGSHQPFATSKPSDNKETLVEVDPAKLNVAMSQGTGQQFAIHSPNDGDMKVDGLTLETLKQLVDQGSKLNISNPLAIYPVPGGKMDLNGVSRKLGNAALNDIDVHIDIARSSDALIDSAETRAASQGYELLVTPVDLDLTFTKDGQTVRSEQLNGYAPKYIALPEGIDPNRITTGVIINSDGSIFHVPTVVTKIDSRYYALINDLRSSGSYSVIWNPQDFEDARSHWGKTDVNNIAARLDLQGNGDNTFSPNRQVTRSEFAEIVVLGLGLMRQDAPQNLFPDVSDSAWFRSAVALANEFGIVRGYDNGNFYGNQEITREQGFAMVARAYRLIEPEASISPDQMNAELERYSDAANVSNWAKEDVAQLIAAGIIQGNGPEVLSPKTTMTRAEVTALIARMLKVTNLIDK
ncbi:hypothetical protein BK131_14405 [Paenibacillus amylolyticus]|uniref:SLH domain-containing protein n=1 Tax=Paenibacillus amylolyticus TaxID=1451 RepID=A0A1R1BVP6_PAEAM|nr:S-layer homology domain-containing protein [Paenibacillus amylolyticus]OMF13848.1 hypothetical protein BK131_14405 [Paenibacillus amylolyticus]